MRLVHEPVQLTTALQDNHFQRIGSHLHTFQSVLNEVIDNFNNYLERQQRKLRHRIFIRTYLCMLDGKLQQNAMRVNADRDLRLQVRLFEIDAYQLERQVEENHRLVAEFLRGAPEIVQAQPNPQLNMSMQDSAAREQVMALLKKSQFAQSDQVGGTRNSAHMQDTSFRDNLIGRLGAL